MKKQETCFHPTSCPTGMNFTCPICGYGHGCIPCECHKKIAAQNAKESTAHLTTPSACNAAYPGTGQVVIGGTAGGANVAQHGQPLPKNDFSNAIIRGDCSIKNNISNVSETNALRCTCKKYICLFKKVAMEKNNDK